MPAGPQPLLRRRHPPPYAVPVRLEFKEGGSSKFWEITLDGSTVKTRWGRIGGPGQTRLEELDDLVAARSSYDRQLGEKLKTGFQMAPGQVPVVPAGKVDAALEQAVRLHPRDERAYLVLADALSEAGDPRGELISVQHALANVPNDQKLQAREKKLLSALKLPDPEWVSLVWRWGFVQAAHFHNSKDWMDSNFDAVALARNVFAMPMCAALEELQLGVLRWEYQAEDVPALLAEAARHAWAARLECLRIGHLPDFDIDMAHHTVGDLSQISRGFPGLRSLVIHAGELELGVISLPLLEELTVETCALNHERLASIANATLPRLERLALWFGSHNYGCNVTVEEVAPILDGARFPRLAHLGLMNAELTDTLCEVLAAAPVLPRLQTVDLSMGTMSDSGAHALARTPAAFRHLREIDVSDNFLSSDGLKALRALGCPVKSKSQKDAAASDRDYRYVTVGE